MRRLFLLFFTASALGMLAQDVPEPLRVGVSLAQRKLTLREAVEMAVSHNLEIEIERTDVATAYQAIKAAQGVYDPVFQWQPALDSQTLPTGSVLQGPTGSVSDRILSQDFTFRQRVPWTGSLLSVDFNNNRQSTTNPFVTLNPFITSRLFLQLTQPLLRNSFVDRERSEIRIRSTQAQVSEADLAVAVIDVITRAEQAYWDLAAALEDVQVKRENVELAREQVARSERMIQAGILADVELSAAEAELQRRLDTYYASVASLTNAENALKLLLAPGRQADIWNDQIIPVDRGALEAPEIYDLRANIKLAMSERPELRATRLLQQANEIQTRLSRNQTRPQLDLVASYASTGLAGDISDRGNPFVSNLLLLERVNQLSTSAGLAPLPAQSFGAVPPLLVGGYEAALSNLFSGRYQSFRVGVSFDLNLRNRTAEAELAQSTIAERRLKLQQSQLEQAIEAQVRNALQALQSSHQRMAAAEASVKAAKIKLESEIRLFQNGESTNFLVLTRQNEYADSRLRLVVAQADHSKALTRLRQAAGRTLREHHVVVK